ncbi:hypothetical protein [Streptomyces sp. NPDC002221]
MTVWVLVISGAPVPVAAVASVGVGVAGGLFVVVVMGTTMEQKID